MAGVVFRYAEEVEETEEGEGGPMPFEEADEVRE